MNPEWFDQLPDWRDEYKSYSEPPLPDMPRFFTGQLKFDPVTLAPAANARLIRSLATLKTIEGIVMKFPTFPEPPMERRLIDQSIDMIQSLLSYALEPTLTDEDVMRWDLLTQAIAQEGHDARE